MRGEARRLILAQSMAGGDPPEEMTGQAVSVNPNQEGELNGGNQN
jgi:hypothetical protein